MTATEYVVLLHTVHGNFLASEGPSQRCSRLGKQDLEMEMYSHSQPTYEFLL